ncbi:hypothetical protein AMTR_s00080p00155960 [Amborella trichopoda]|uniref:Uncharacterized protein n=1 Tax=Amborella trichopoda TaxID=13333 RepID=W1PBH0_AMBTC|nr:hypothetical protein AMTR_s00080p00155960 [Amborella trichopoda]
MFFPKQLSILAYVDKVVKELKDDLEVRQLIHLTFQMHSSMAVKTMALVKISVLENESYMAILELYIEEIEALLVLAFKRMRDPLSCRLEQGDFRPLVRQAGRLKAS